MKTVALAFVLALVGCASPAESQSSADSEFVSDAASMTQNPDGSFTVTCKDGVVEHDVSVDAIHADNVCKPRPTLSCSLSYWFPGFPNGGDSAEVNVQDVHTPFDGAATINVPLGDAGAPYTGRVHIGPQGETNRSEFTLQISKNDALVAYTEGTVRTQSLATPGSQAFMVGFVRSSTWPNAFTYKGVQYTGIDVACSLWPVAH